MDNRITLDPEGYIYGMYIGYQTYESANTGGKEIAAIAQTLREQGKPVRILIDLTQIGKTHSGARKIASETLKTMDYDKMAIFGQGLFIKNLVNLVVMAAGRGDKVRYFATKDDALSWLKQ